MVRLRMNAHRLAQTDVFGYAGNSPGRPAVKIWLHTILILVLLPGLPLAGIHMAKYDVSAYLEFPPRTQYVEHAPYSRPIFISLTAVILAVMVPFLVRVMRANLPKSRGSAALYPAVDVAEIRALGIPWWGRLALALGILFWILAWTRFQWMDALQLYTFTPQWLAYIVAINALTFRRTGRCLLTHQTGFFLWLFPLSATFWWFFEYLNRFVQNWWYTCGADFTPVQYIIAATLPFSTVLPAVLSTEEWLTTHPRSYAGLEHFIPVRISRPNSAAWMVLAASCAGLIFIGRYPDYLFPLLWLAPLLLLIAFQRLANRSGFFPELECGDWRRVFRFALAALICGFFWEMWNWHSLARWIYTIPYVHRFQLFEMPILGYAGYLPFGLECAIFADLIRRRPF